MKEQTFAGWFYSNSDRLFMLVMFFGLCSYTLHLIHHGPEFAPSVSWAENLAGQAFASFITMIMGPVTAAIKNAVTPKPDAGPAPEVK